MASPQLQLSEVRLIGANTSQQIFSMREIPSFAESGILFSGITEAKAGFSWMRYEPEVSQLLITIDGEGEVLIDNKWSRTAPGIAYLTPAGTPHAYRAVPGRRWRICWVNYLGRPASLAACLPDRPAAISVPPKQLWITLAGLGEAIAHHAPPSLLNSWGPVIHQTVLHHLKARGKKQQLTKLWDLVRTELAHPWTLDELAVKAGMSRESLRRACLRECHCSPMHFVGKLRFQKAVEMLSEGDEKIQTIAELLGYGDPFTFSAAFKRVMGVCPSKFR